METILQVEIFNRSRVINQLKMIIQYLKPIYDNINNLGPLSIPDRYVILPQMVNDCIS